MLSSGTASAENDAEDLGTFGQSHEHYSEHQRGGTPFSTPDLGPKANNHSATEVHTGPSQAGTCSTPETLSTVAGPH